MKTAYCGIPPLPIAYTPNPVCCGRKPQTLPTLLFSLFLDNRSFEQTVAIPADYRIFLELPRSVPIGVNARVSISIPTVFDSQNGIEPVKELKSYRGILKGRGISVERLRELQWEDKALEEAIGFYECY